ncbi:hypothetical protein SO802_026637 [Lithocarpus litseifolius]|uniref:Uncharacterized protein n=1 Tax=Lithocarpus litseifolius TaxID=425828 RepID=A0AAW2C2R4_9ROSI
MHRWKNSGNISNCQNEASEVAISKQQAQFSILFKLHTTKDSNKEAFCVNLWRSSQGVTTNEVGQNFFLAIFGYEMGELLMVDAPKSGLPWGPFLRIRVNVDITKPLMRDTRDEDEDDIQSVAEDFDDSLHHRQIPAELPMATLMINPRQSVPFGTLPGRDNYSGARKEVGS